LKNSKAASSRYPTEPVVGLSDHEISLIETFKRVSPSVANIKTTTVVQARQGFSLRSLEVPQGTGSGFLWDEKGHVVTNYHVVTSGRKDGRLPSSVKVKLAGMSEALDADVVGVEPEKDIAVLKVRNTRNLPRPIDVGTSNDLQVGQSVLAVGNPFGLDDTLTTGIVSALGRDVDGIGGRPIHGCIQTDAAINPGNSGGPLLDSRGRLIGVNTAIFSPNGAGNVGIGFAIPVDTVRRVVNQIIMYGKVRRPSLGISIVDDRIVRSIAGQLGRPLDGCLVAEVVPNSPAVAAGLKATAMSSDGSIVLGDLVTGVNGEPVRQAEDLISAIEEKNEGDVVRLTILRKCDPDKPETIVVKLTTRDKLDEGASTSDKATSQPRSFPIPWQ
jgi:S1-C subfamily serine protease